MRESIAGSWRSEGRQSRTGRRKCRTPSQGCCLPRRQCRPGEWCPCRSWPRPRRLRLWPDGCSPSLPMKGPRSCEPTINLHAQRVSVKVYSCLKNTSQYFCPFSSPYPTSTTAWSMSGFAWLQPLKMPPL